MDKIKIFLGALILLCGSIAQAETFRYEYQGNPFNSVSDPDEILPSGLTAISGWFEVDTLIEPNSTFTSIDGIGILGAYVTDGVPELW